MIEPILKGILLGLLLTVLIGPVFFVLIETSLRRGVKQALFIDLGVFFSDVLFIVLAYIFTNEVEDMKSEQGFMQIVGGAMFAIFGLAALFKKHKVPSDKREHIKIKAGNNLFIDIFKGFVLNALNPSVIFFWLAMVSVAQEDFGADRSHVVVFFVSLLITFFGFDVLKIVGASYLKRFITPRLLLHLNKAIGVGLFIFGGVLIWKGIAE